VAQKSASLNPKQLAMVLIRVCCAGVIVAPGLKYTKSDKFVALFTQKRPSGRRQARGEERENVKLCGFL